MSTKNKLRKYKRLLAKNLSKAQAFLVANSDDQLFLTIIKLRRNIVPALLKAGKVLRKS